MEGNMNGEPVDVRALAQAAATALRQGRHADARRLFEQVVASGRADASVRLGLAYACFGTGDAPAGLAATDLVLAQEPGNLRALLLKADHLLRSGDSRGAVSHYQAVVATAAAQGPLPPDLAREVARAQSMCQRHVTHFEAALRQRLAPLGLDDSSAERFAQSLDILFGRRRIYVQEPRNYYFPGLPQVQFYPRADFPWLDAVEAATGEIRAELEAVLREEGAFSPYVKSVPGRPPQPGNVMLDNPDWSAFYLWKDGAVVPGNAARCPRTLAALEGAPLCRLPDRSPSILFSMLRPHTRIPPHNGLVNTRLIVHLPLIVPPGCGFRVGNETREWVEGKAWVFDDSIDHEAWNDSDRTRVILLFEVWRPELSERERAMVQALFAAIDEHAGQKPVWEI
jgi:aspartyl/asparaginyl beta-hydroxylase (cupin superfamily)